MGGQSLKWHGGVMSQSNGSPKYNPICGNPSWNKPIDIQNLQPTHDQALTSSEEPSQGMKCALTHHHMLWKMSNGFHNTWWVF